MGRAKFHLSREPDWDCWALGLEPRMDMENTDSLEWRFVRLVRDSVLNWRRDVYVGDPGDFFCLMAARYLPKWRAVRRQPTETNTIDVNSNRHRHLGRLTPSARRWAGKGWTLVSSERNATLAGPGGWDLPRSRGLRWDRWTQAAASRAGPSGFTVPLYTSDASDE